MNNSNSEQQDPKVNQPADVIQSEQTTIELALEDRSAIDTIENFASETIQPKDIDSSNEQKAEAGNMPNVLVDEELLAEIASIPDRFGFKIGDVADMLGIKQYVLRYWEQEFDLLRPKKAANNQRLYTKKDVENAYLIRKLLYRDKFSIEGARRALKDVKFAVKKEKDFHSVVLRIEHVQEQIKNFISEIRKTKSFFN